MKFTIPLFLMFVFSVCASASDELENAQFDSFKEYCAINDCRKNRLVKFRTDGEEVEQLLEYYYPVVQGETLSLLPEDKVYIEAEVVDGKFINLKQVQTPLNEEKTITFNFSQKDDKTDMILSVNNPFDVGMKFHLDMIDFEGNAHQTSSCPVLAGTDLFEHWPHVIPEIIVSNIRAVELTDTFSCVY